MSLTSGAKLGPYEIQSPLGPRRNGGSLPCSQYASVRPMDAAPDGRILVMLQADQEVAPPITLVLNWDTELRN